MVLKGIRGDSELNYAELKLLRYKRWKLLPYHRYVKVLCCQLPSIKKFLQIHLRNYLYYLKQFTFLVLQKFFERTSLNPEEKFSELIVLLAKYQKVCMDRQHPIGKINKGSFGYYKVDLPKNWFLMTTNALFQKHLGKLFCCLLFIFFKFANNMQSKAKKRLKNLLMLAVTCSTELREDDAKILLGA